MEKLLSALRAAGEPTRLRLLALLGHGELTVTELTHILGQSQPRVSRHLKLMMEAGIIERFSEGTWAFFRLTDKGQEGRYGKTIFDLIPTDDDLYLRDQEKLAEIRKQRREEASKYFENIAEKWNEIRSLYVSETDVEAAIVDTIKPLAVKSVLDIGTGTGRMLELLSPIVDQATGIDLSRDMLGIARTLIADKAMSNCQVRVGDMYNLSSSNEAHDLVLLHQVLHYADDPDAVIREASRVIKKNANLVIIDFAPHQLEFMRDQHAHRRLGFDDDDISRWGANAGLQIKNVQHLEGGELTVVIWHLVKSS